MPNKLKELIFKPKWQHKEARIRAHAVARSQDPRLIEKLAEFARTDPDAGVRLNAARRLTDIRLMHHLAYEDTDAKVRDYAGRVFRGLMTGDHEASPGADVRAEILAGLDDQELIEQLATKADDEVLRSTAQAQISKQGMLGDIAIGDPSPALRHAAAKRIEQMSTLERVASAARKSDKKVFRLVSKRLEGLQIEAGNEQIIHTRSQELCQAVEALARADIPLAERMETLARLQSDWQGLESQVTPEVALRFASGARILELATQGSQEDPNARNRAHALGALEAFLLAAEPLGKSDAVEDIGRVQAQVQHGQKILADSAEHLESADKERLNQVMEALESTRERLFAAQPPDPALARICKQVEKATPERCPLEKTDKMRAEWDRAWSGLTHPNPSDDTARNRFLAAWTVLRESIVAREAKRDECLASIEQLLETLETKLENGNLAESAAAKQAVLDALDLIGHHPQVSNPDFKARIVAAKSKLDELRKWQHWANNEVRARLCQHAEDILGKGIHPDAVTEKLKELQARWKALDHSERLPGDAPNRRPNPALWRRFNGACNQAFKVAKPFFEKRSEVRGRHLEEMQQICEQLAAAAKPQEDEDQKSLERLVVTARKSLRDLDSIPPAKRKLVARKLREGAKLIDDRLEDGYQIVERRKQKLIDEVLALVEVEDLDQAINGAKDAQKRWQSAGHTRRYREQKLWKAFRAASDSVFARLEDKRAGEKAERKASIDTLNALIQEVRELLASVPENHANAPGELRRLREAWRQVGFQDRKFEQSFQGLCEDVETAIANASRQSELKQHQRQRDLAGLARQAEQVRLGGDGDIDAIRSAWQELSAEGEVLEAISQRFSQADSDDGDFAQRADELLESAQALCIQAEFFSGMESPVDCQEQRMAYQVSRLSERMGGGNASSPKAEATELESKWLALGPLPLDKAQELDRRFWAAIEHFEKTA